MEQGSKRIAVIGAGASGCACVYHLLNSGCDVTLFDKASFLRTILPTGGGRCNLAHAEFDIKDLAKNYPRGEKFLYSVFSRFSTYDTLDFFEKIGIKTYVQENGRIFPVSNSAKDVREKFLSEIKKAFFIQEEVLDILPLDNGFKLKSTKAEYLFDAIVVAIGGHSGYRILENLGLKIVSPHPSLVGLKTKEQFQSLSGTVVKSVKWNGIEEDLLFTHFGISGPLVYKISALKAFDDFPYYVEFDLCENLYNFQELLNKNPHKEIKNLLSEYLPQKVVNFILSDVGMNTKCHSINGKIRDLILERIHKFRIEIIGTNKGEETVTAGGVDLRQINSKTMEAKTIPNLYIVGEVLNIDGFCGGFNLQNAWSTAYIAAQSIIT